jgi:YidC/Oxa1 family membrane protein insertase
MNNQQRSPSQQMFMVLALSFFGWYVLHNFFGVGQPPNQNPQRPLKAVPALQQIFAGIDPKQGKPLTKEEGLTEIKKLNGEVTPADKDPYAYWARLRAGLIQQYIVEDDAAAIARYDEIIKHAGTDAVTAQATYQKGDLLWRRSTANGGQPSSEAASTLEQIIHKGRGASPFLNLEIFVPQAAVGAGSTPPAFHPVKVETLLKVNDPQGISYRVNHYYETAAGYKVYFHKLFDAVVTLFGNRPNYSYGLAILFFAIVTRLLMQPITKRQYESMKGMSIIAPEMKKIQDKYKGKSEQQAQVQMMKEIRELQSRHGVNPMTGCGLALIQMPIFFFVVYPLIQCYEPKMEMVGASFLWIHNLARPDLPLLIAYAISMFFSFRLSSVPPTDDMQRQQQMIMSFVMPVLFPFFLLSWPSAFTMYWMIFNVMSTTFQYRMMKAADPDKNLIKTLIGTGSAPVAAVEAVVPARPKTKPRTIVQNSSKSALGTDGSSSSVAMRSAKPNGTTRNRPNGADGQGRARAKDVEEMPGDDALASANSRDEGVAPSGGGASSDGIASNGTATARKNEVSRRSQRARRRRRY